MEDCNEEDFIETPELPLEIIVYILSFLHTSDRKEASLVSRSWYYASQDLHFQKNVIFCFPASSSSLELIRGLGGKSRCSLIISQLDGFSMSRSLLLEVQYATTIKNISLLGLAGFRVVTVSYILIFSRLFTAEDKS